MPHAPAEIPLRGLNDDMVVIVHEAIGMFAVLFLHGKLITNPYANNPADKATQ